ncbi:MAG: hypothetical protein H7287_12845 [Thermoleophilia bacterium]|nr:hypothetical protein [Thermoleophilia bacterium]
MRFDPNILQHEQIILGLDARLRAVDQQLELGVASSNAVPERGSFEELTRVADDLATAASIMKQRVPLRPEYALQLSEQQQVVRDAAQRMSDMEVSRQPLGVEWGALLDPMIATAWEAARLVGSNVWNTDSSRLPKI